MLSVEEITPIPGEQRLIQELGEGLHPLYRDDLSHHNFGHAHDEVLPEVIRLDGLQPVSKARGRLEMIAAALGHDAGTHLPIDPERRETKEERAIRLIRPVIVECGFRGGDITEIDGMVLATGPGVICETPGQIKLRRADIGNVGRKRLEFLATAVNIFHEETVLAEEQHREIPVWGNFTAAQQQVLLRLLAQDLSLGNERVSKGMGPFNRAALRNAQWLSKGTVRDANRFHAKYDQYMRPLVGEAALAAIA